MLFSRQHLGFLGWLLIVVLAEFFLLAAMLPASTLQATGQQEYLMTQAFLGKDTAETLRKRADDFYDATFNKTGLVQESFALFIPSQEEQKISKGLEKLGQNMFGYIEGRMVAFWMAVYLGVHRIGSILLWLPGFMPVLLAASYDAMAKRRIRQLNFAMSSAMVFGTSKTLFYVLMMGPLIYALFPLPVPSVVAPLWCAALGGAWAGMVVNWPSN